MFFFFYRVPTSAPDQFDTVNVSVNLYTAEGFGTRVFHSPESSLKHWLVGFLFKLHSALLSRETGITLKDLARPAGEAVWLKPLLRAASSPVLG